MGLMVPSCACSHLPEASFLPMGLDILKFQALHCVLKAWTPDQQDQLHLERFTMQTLGPPEPRRIGVGAGGRPQVMLLF